METEKTPVTAVLVQAARFDGSIWAKVIRELGSLGIGAFAVHLPLTSLSADAAGRVVLVGHTYGDAVVHHSRRRGVYEGQGFRHRSFREQGRDHPGNLGNQLLTLRRPSM